MKKSYIFFVIIIALTSIIGGCSKKDVYKYIYTYHGENKLWKAKYTINSTATFTEKKGTLDGETESNNEFVITYKGKMKDLSNVRHWEISYKNNTGGGKRSEDCDEGKGMTSKIIKMQSSSKNGALPNKDDIIKVTINIDGDIQKLNLKNTYK